MKRPAPASDSPRPKRSPSPGPGSRWRRRPEARPADILSAALDTFVENGYAATRLDDVAKRAHISKGTLYLYFESKEALFQAVVRESIVRVIERGEEMLDRWEGPSEALLSALIRSWWDAVSASRVAGLPKLMLSEATHFPDVARFYFSEVVQRSRRLFARALQRGIDRGEFRAIDVDYAVRVLTAPVAMALIWKHSMVKCGIDELDVNRHLDALIDIFAHGVLKNEGDSRD